jgi:hypothetical protein
MLFTYFTSIRFEEKASDLSHPPDEPGMEERWLATLYVESTGGEKHTLKIFSLPGENGASADLFKALVIHNDNPEALVIKYIYLDVLMRGLPAYFGDKPLRH